MSKKRLKYVVLVYPRQRFDARVMDIARRTSDRFGHNGILAKSGETDLVVAHRGWMEITWATRREARRYQASLARHWGLLFRTTRRRRWYRSRRRP